jgi:hypothetical protein
VGVTIKLANFKSRLIAAFGAKTNIMSDKQIYQLTERTSVAATDWLVGQINDGSAEARKILLSTIKDFVTQEDVVTTTVEGVDDTTTAELAYGVNVIDTASNADFCARLPLVPSKGRSTTVINISTHVVRLFPSVSGGDINGVVDGYIDIAPNSLPVILKCYENPLPGSWGSVQAPAGTRKLILLDEIKFTHAASLQNYVGVGKFNDYFGSYGAATSSQKIGLTPDAGGSSKYWRTERGILKCVNIKIITNVKNTDLQPGSNIVISPIIAYKTGANAVTYSAIGTLILRSSGPSIGSGGITGGVVGIEGVIGSDTVEAGDFSTQWINWDMTSGGFDIGEGQYSQYFYTIGITIPANAAAKDYRFKVELEGL